MVDNPGENPGAYRPSYKWYLEIATKEDWQPAWDSEEVTVHQALFDAIDDALACVGDLIGGPYTEDEAPASGRRGPSRRRRSGVRRERAANPCCLGDWQTSVQVGLGNCVCGCVDGCRSHSGVARGSQDRLA